MKCPTEEQILKAAKESNVEEALKKLFPEVFDKSIILPRGRIKSDTEATEAGLGHASLFVRSVGPYKQKGFCLSKEVNWSIVDDGDYLVLVPTKK